MDYETVLQFLRTKDYWERGLFLKDIDVTMDYAGSFDREEVIGYMVTNHDFRCQGAVENATKTYWTIATKLDRIVNVHGDNKWYVYAE